MSKKMSKAYKEGKTIPDRSWFTTDVGFQEAINAWSYRMQQWLDRLEEIRAGSLFDNHWEAGMMYVLRTILNQDTSKLEKQAVEWHKQMVKRWKKELKAVNELRSKKDA